MKDFKRTDSRADVLNTKHDKKNVKFVFKRLTKQEISESFREGSKSSYQSLIMLGPPKKPKQRKMLSESAHSKLDKKVKVYYSESEKSWEVSLPPTRRVGELIQDIIYYEEDESK